MEEKEKEEQILESHTEIKKPVVLAGFKSNDDIYEFEERKKVEILRNTFLKNRRKINPIYRNCLANANDRFVDYGDIVVYEAKDYRVVGKTKDSLIIKNTKRILTVPNESVGIKIKDLDGANAIHIYNFLSQEVESGVFDVSDFFMGFLSIFDVDGIEIYKSLSKETQERLKRAIRR